MQYTGLLAIFLTVLGLNTANANTVTLNASGISSGFLDPVFTDADGSSVVVLNYDGSPDFGQFWLFDPSWGSLDSVTVKYQTRTLPLSGNFDFSYGGPTFRLFTYRYGWDLGYINWNNLRPGDVVTLSGERTFTGADAQKFLPTLGAGYTGLIGQVFFYGTSTGVRENDPNPQGLWYRAPIHYNVDVTYNYTGPIQVPLPATGLLLGLSALALFMPAVRRRGKS